MSTLLRSVLLLSVESKRRSGMRIYRNWTTFYGKLCLQSASLCPSAYYYWNNSIMDYPAKVAGIFEEYVLLALKESHKSTSSCRHREHTYFLIALSFSFASEKGIPCQRQWHSTARRIHYYRRNTETEQLSDSFFLFLFFSCLGLSYMFMYY